MSSDEMLLYEENSFDELFESFKKLKVKKDSLIEDVWIDHVMNSYTDWISGAGDYLYEVERDRYVEEQINGGGK